MSEFYETFELLRPDMEIVDFPFEPREPRNDPNPTNPEE